LDDAGDGLRLAGAHGPVRLRGELIFLRIQRRDVQLDHVGPQLTRHPGGVVDGIERVVAALGLQRFPPRVCPDDDRHAQPLRLGPDVVELEDVLVLGGRPDVERVADRVGAQPHRVLHRRRQRRHGRAVGRDVGLPIEFEDERKASSELAMVFLRQADVGGDGAEPALVRQAPLEAGVGAGGVGQEVDGAVLQALVDGDDEQAAVGRPGAEQEPVQPGALPGTQVQVGQPRAGRRLGGRRLNLHRLDSNPST
jgi:hypothetical protein